MAFIRTEQIRFQHCDPAGIVFYPRYVEMVNATVEDWFAERIGHSFAEIHGPMDAAIPAVALNIEFLAPSSLGQRLTFGLTVNRVGRTSASLGIQAECEDTIRFRAGLTLVHISKADYRPCPWPSFIREKLELDLLQSAPP